ncbi:MAG: flagellar protein [Anaerolineales bacterium]|nr:flagellar protein [Anaerolineales bacterium]
MSPFPFDPARLTADPRLQATDQVRPPARGTSAPAEAGQTSFADALDQARGLTFSNHAKKRLETRQITLSDDGLNRLMNAVDKAEQRGSRDSLVLMDDLAFIVNVYNRTVVTALDTQARGEGIFTNIDSVVLADAKA